MKIAITSKGVELGSEVDPRFGRAPYILIVDLTTLEIEPIDNQANVNAFKGAGIQAATMIAGKNVDALLTGYCGPNAFKTLEAAGIKVVAEVAGGVKEAIERFLKGEMQFSQNANAEAHW